MRVPGGAEKTHALHWQRLSRQREKHHAKGIKGLANNYCEHSTYLVKPGIRVVENLPVSN